MTSPERPLRAGTRSWATRVAVLSGCVALGLALQSVVSAHLESIQALARHDAVQARAELAFLLRAVAIGVFGLTGALGVVMIASCRRAIEAGRYPPPGAWSFGSQGVVTGPRALLLARVNMALAVTLIACSLAGGALTWYAAARLLACRAP